MKVEVLTLCDYAVAVPGGKLTIVGTFDRLALPKLPHQQPSFYLVAKVRFDITEAGEKRLQFTFTDPDGKQIAALPEMKVPVKLREEDYTAAMQVVLRINGLPLSQAGDHSVNLVIDGTREASVSLTIQIAKPKAG
ncbi:hypothetical protein Verru16b_01752 [Lacunisphaera limnophila]|uniref:Uncharacterized protein n=1 Tax=Lacunisphaera limnophila TaxID=1838286 RepID=A0A1D8AUZ4_9BACT|nr:hypothetical protein [Lacunisphaera limnophila]AOS44685.1 hypothetical protein Verru16b_01752 [Lacunisphaera limnophila]